MSAVLLSILAFVVALAAMLRAFFDRYEYRRTVGRIAAEAYQAKRLLSIRTQLAGEVAHEIRNPMTAIISSVEALDLLIGPQIDPEIRKSFQHIRENGQHLLRLLTDFLELNRFQNDSPKARPEKVNVGDAVDSTAGLLRAFAQRKHISLLAVGVDQEFFAEVDPRYLKQILFNLVHNAIKFTPERGVVSISVSEEVSQKRIKVTIQDTGPGIDHSEINKVFELFVQGSSGAGQGEGFGVGLALCRRLLELSQGGISVSSSPGAGATFEFWLPMFRRKAAVSQSNLPMVSGSPEMSSSTPVASGTAYQPLAGQAFLLVDDNTQARDAIAKLIEAWGGLVDQVSEAVDAVDALNQRNYDAVMVDSTTEGMQGYELASLLREHAKSSGTTIILASTEPIDESTAQGFGVDKCIEKPLRGDELLQSLLASGRFQVSH